MKFEITLDKIETIEDLRHYIQLVEKWSKRHVLDRPAYFPQVQNFLFAIGAAQNMAESDNTIQAVTGVVSVDSRATFHDVTWVHFGWNIAAGTPPTLTVERGTQIFKNFDGRVGKYMNTEDGVFGWVVINHDLQRLVWVYPKKG